MAEPAEDAAAAENGDGDQRSTHHQRPPTSSSSPRRISNTNPQSSSPPRKRNNDEDVSAADEKVVDDKIEESPLRTPLSTLSTLLQNSHNYKQNTLQLFRTSHSLHLNAIDRKQKASEALRLAQAEYEHASTAEEFAAQELRFAKRKKDDANSKYNALRTDVTTLASQFAGLRVILVNLESNSNWNGRCGTIENLITDGGISGDIGRWKVKLDSDWRGKEPDGNYEGGGNSSNQVLSQDRYHVMVKAKNLELIESDSGGLPSLFLGGGRRRGQEVGVYDGDAVESRSLLSPSTSHHHDSEGKKKGKQQHQPDPVEELPDSHFVTPERRGGRRRMCSNDVQQRSPYHFQHGETEYDWKTNALGSHHSPPGYYDDELDNHYAQPPVVLRRPIPVQWQGQQPLRLQRIHRHHHQQQQQQPQRQQQQPHTPRTSTRISLRSLNSPSIMQQHMYDRNRVSSSFSNMVSPMTFEPASFREIETSESFHQHNVNDNSASSFLCRGSFDASNDDDNGKHVSVDHSRRDHQDRVLERIDNSNSTRGHHPRSMSLPTVVVIHVDNDDEDGNKNGPPTCLGVQNADISHVNGVYVLAPSNDENESSSQPNASDDTDAPPLYFRDGDPLLLSDGRYYDMCILRINCPDSPDHVIWFLSRVDVDPNCLEVKFSDCYYYCRVLRSVGLHVPPMNGWNVPDVEPDMEFMTETKAFPPLDSGSRTEKDQQAQVIQAQQ